MMAYYPDDALAEVKAFLATSQTHGGLQKSTTSVYPDRKVAEAGWVLEASLNYLKNVNLTKPTLREITRTLEVENYTDATGDLLISGTDLTAKFDAFMTDLATEESTDGSTAKLADARITSVSPTKTILEVKVDMGKGESGQWQVQICDQSNGNIPPAQYCSFTHWYYNLEDILHSAIVNPLFFEINGCSSPNPWADELALHFDDFTPLGLCYYDDAVYNSTQDQINHDAQVIIDLAKWEISDLCSGEWNCARKDIFTTDCTSDTPKLLCKINDIHFLYAPTNQPGYSEGYSLSVGSICVGRPEEYKP